MQAPLFAYYCFYWLALLSSSPPLQTKKGKSNIKNQAGIISEEKKKVKKQMVKEEEMKRETMGIIKQGEAITLKEIRDIPMGKKEKRKKRAMS